MKYASRTLLLVVGMLAALAACQTAPSEIPEDLDPAEYFQRAQEAVDANRYETALAYYETVIERFPNDQATQLAAQYEIAFINYKMGNDERATELFEELIGRYEEQNGAELPQWPRVLAEEVLDRIESGESAATPGRDNASSQGS